MHYVGRDLERNFNLCVCTDTSLDSDTSVCVMNDFLIDDVLIDDFVMNGCAVTERWSEKWTEIVEV